LVITLHIILKTELETGYACKLLLNLAGSQKLAWIQCARGWDTHRLFVDRATLGIYASHLFFSVGLSLCQKSSLAAEVVESLML